MEIVQVAARVDEQIAQALVDLATREKRSLSAQIALILEQYVASLEAPVAPTEG